jgi:hypothetical protein
MRLALKFALGVITYWGTFVTGTALVGAVSIWQTTGHRVAPGVYWVMAGTGLLVGSYKMWKDEYDRYQIRNREANIVEVEFKQFQEVHKKWEFAIEFLKATRTVTTFKRGDSPFVSVSIWVLIHNRGVNPTTVLVRRVAVESGGRIDAGFQRPTMIPGGRFNFENPEEYEKYEIVGSSSAELLLCMRRYNPPQIELYLHDQPLLITVEFEETFGTRCKVTGSLTLESIERQ